MITRFFKSVKKTFVRKKILIACLLFIFLILVALAIFFLILWPTGRPTETVTYGMLGGEGESNTEKREQPEVPRYYTDGFVYLTLSDLDEIAYFLYLSEEKKLSLSPGEKKITGCSFSKNLSAYNEFSLALKPLELKVFQKPKNKELKKILKDLETKFTDLKKQHQESEKKGKGGECIPSLLEVHVKYLQEILSILGNGIDKEIEKGVNKTEIGKEIGKKIGKEAKVRADSLR